MKGSESHQAIQRERTHKLVELVRRSSRRKTEHDPNRSSLEYGDLIQAADGGAPVYWQHVAVSCRLWESNSGPPTRETSIYIVGAIQYIVDRPR